MNTISTERLAELIVWLDRKWARHHEEEDLEAAEALRELLHLRAQCESRDTAALVRTPDKKSLAAYLARWIFELGANSPYGPAHRMQVMHGKYPHAERPGAGLAEGPMADQLEEALRARASAMKEGMVGKV